MENYNLAIQAIAAFIRTLPADQQEAVWNELKYEANSFDIDIEAELLLDDAD